MNLRPSLLVCALAAVLAAIGCGDDEGGDGVSTGLPADDELSSLSDAEAKQVCRETEKSFSDLLPASELERIACHGIAVTSIVQESGGAAGSDDIAMCRQIANECLSSDQVDPSDLELMVDADCDNATTESTFGDCDATVGDYERCAARVRSLVRAQIQQMSCDLLENPEEIEEAMSLDVDVANDPACSSIRTKCPEVDLGFGDEDIEEEG